MRHGLILLTLACGLTCLCQWAKALPVFKTTFILSNPTTNVTSAAVLDYIQRYLYIEFINETSQVSIATLASS